MKKNDFIEIVAQANKEFTPKEAVFFSWLCAVRVLPILGAAGHFDYWEEKPKHLFSIFTALDMTASFASLDLEQELKRRAIFGHEGSFASLAAKAEYDASNASLEIPPEAIYAKEVVFTVSWAACVTDLFSCGKHRKAADQVRYVASAAYDAVSNVVTATQDSQEVENIVSIMLDDAIKIKRVLTIE